MMRPRSERSLTPADLRPIRALLRAANGKLSGAYPGARGGREPIHTVYGGAHLFRADLASKLGKIALASLDEHAPDARTFAAAFPPSKGDANDSAALAETVRARVLAKLRSEPVEDLRIDFEDGYGERPDSEEDRDSLAAAEQVAAGLERGTLPPFIGIRIKALGPEQCERGLRTLDLFVTALVRASSGRLPGAFAVTVPKVMSAAHVTAAERACRALERRLGLVSGSLRLELMIEAPQAILDAEGASPLRALVRAGRGRVTSAHFGAYDYTALCGISAAWQQPHHPLCDFARHMMQVALAQTGISLVDSPTTILPVGPHRPPPNQPLSAAERAENRDAVHRGWTRHYDNVRRSMANGFYRGWDVHPAQLVSRYAACYAFFLEARPAATVRLRNFIDRAAQATRVGGVFDDAATAAGLVNFFARGLSSGALTRDEIEDAGLTLADLQAGG